jgi:hypothetical protein
MMLCTATGNGSTTTFIDALNLNHEQSILLGRHGIFSGGTADNLGRVVRVTGNTKATQTITFVPTLSTATAIGDELELWNLRDEGLTPNLINNFIDDVVLDVYEHAPLPVASDAFTFDANEPIIAIDELEVDGVADGTNWEAVTGVDWRHLSSDDSVVYGWVRIDTADLDVDRESRTITIKGRHRWLCDGNSMRVRGANISGALGGDSVTTPVSAEFVAHQVAAMALGYRLEKAYDRKDLDITRATLQTRADQLRPKNVLRLKGRYWRLS